MSDLFLVSLLPLESEITFCLNEFQNCMKRAVCCLCPPTPNPKKNNPHSVSVSGTNPDSQTIKTKLTQNDVPCSESCMNN